MATVRGLTLEVPGVDVVTVAYHEASRSDALALRPVGTCVRNANRWKFDTPSPTRGPDYIVMSSRGRRHPATSALDVAVPRGSKVVSPATGTVIRVKRYYLYGKYLDHRVEIRPDANPKLVVVMIHVDRVTIRKGDLVTAGMSSIGIARVFPFHSQVNNYVGWDVPHVHIEVKRVGS
ncbi:MAG: peptidoglycan DD-metalloendopeptidase family protein [Actinomycetota bacterium]